MKVVGSIQSAKRVNVKHSKLDQPNALPSQESMLSTRMQCFQKQCIDQITWSVCSCNDKQVCSLPNEFPSDYALVLDFFGALTLQEFSLEDSRRSYLPLPSVRDPRLKTVAIRLKFNCCSVISILMFLYFKIIY